MHSRKPPEPLRFVWTADLFKITIHSRDCNALVYMAPKSSSHFFTNSTLFCRLTMVVVGILVATESDFTATLTGDSWRVTPSFERCRDENRLYRISLLPRNKI